MPIVLIKKQLENAFKTTILIDIYAIPDIFQTLNVKCIWNDKFPLICEVLSNELQNLLPKCIFTRTYMNMKK